MDERQRIINITTWIAGVAAVVVTLLLPLGYFAVSYQHMAGSLEAEAEMTSHVISDVINADPELWQFEQLRLEEALARRLQAHHRENRRIFDSKKRLVAERVTALKPPLLTREFDLMDSGVPVGTLQLSTSLYPLLLRSCLVALIGLSGGMLIFITLRILPLRAVNQAQKSLRESEERYQRLAENAPNAILVYGTELVLYANSAALRLFGAEKTEQLVGQTLASIFHPDKRELAMESLQQAVEAGFVGSHRELKLVRFDGTPIEVAAMGIRINYEGTFAVQIILHNITERKRLQDELSDKVAQLEAALTKVKQLEGIIPICMYCKKIRNDMESWQQLESYITEHSEALFSHGICPECYQKVMSESLKELEEIKK